MKVTFVKLNMEHFKNQEAFSVEFGPITRISGRNGAGKSSSGEAVTWLLYGVDMMGSKMDPTPLTAQPEDTTKVELLLNIEREDQEPFELLLGKQIKKGKVSYFVNEIPEKAGRFDEVVSELFDKDLFLSIFNPVYFPSQHWKQQRGQLLKYVEEPFKAEILERLSKNAKVTLEQHLNRFSIEQLVKKYSPIYKDAKVKVERAGERYITLKEQLEAAQEKDEGKNLEGVERRIKELQRQLVEIKGGNNEAYDLENKRGSMQHQLKTLKEKMHSLKAAIDKQQQEPIKENCDTCKQPLTTEALEQVKQHKQERITNYAADGKKIAAEFKEIYAELEALPAPIEAADTGGIQQELFELKSRLDAKERIAELNGMVETAELAKDHIRQELLEAQGILEAAKEYETAKAELMVKKVGALFDKLTVRLFKEHKNGNQEPDFEIEYQGRPYAKLSTAERIKAGLELVEALVGQAKISLPVFVDNAESIVTFKQPSGQLITATVKNSHLVVKQEGAE